MRRRGGFNTQLYRPFLGDKARGLQSMPMSTGIDVTLSTGRIDRSFRLASGALAELVRLWPEAVMELRPITAQEVKRRMDGGEAVVLLDSRADEVWRKAESQVPTSIRVPPDAVEPHFSEIPRGELVVPYCT
jgi:hypothetical protein